MLIKILVLIILTFMCSFPSEVLCEGIELVRWGEPYTIGSSYGQYWTQAQRAIWSIPNVPPYILGIIIGLILGDCNLRQIRGGKNAYLTFGQSIKHRGYFTLVFRYLAVLCQSYPRLRVRMLQGTKHYCLVLQARALPCFTVLYDLFYINGIKVIPPVEFMYPWLSPIALAHWIQCDGSYNGYGLELCTDSFSIPDSVILLNILIVRYDLRCSLRLKDGKYPRIYILSESIPRLRAIVLPYVDPSMLYKLGL